MSNHLGRYLLVGLALFVGVNAIGGAVWVVPGLPLQWLAGTPFRDYTIPALALGVIVGLGSVVAAALVVVRPRWGVVAAALVGGSLMVFEIVETTVVGLDIWLHALGLAPVAKGLPATDLTGVPVLAGVPLPLWQQPLFFLLGALMAWLALRSAPRSGPRRQLRPAWR